MKGKWLLATAVAMLPALALAQQDVSVENTGVVERPMAEGQILPETHNVHTILWTDTGADSYNVYVSDQPITSVDAANVFRIATEVPAGQQAFEYALLTPFAPGDVTNYYAVTGISGGAENSTVTPGVNATTEGTAGTTEFGQPFFWFVDAPFIDADFSDWPFDPIFTSADNPNNFVGGEIDNGDDYSGSIAVGTTATDLYLRAQMNDDTIINVNETGTGDIWQGDAIEWYIGLYDLRPSKMRHPTTQFGNESDPTAAEPDWQIVIAANAFDEPRRSFLFDAGVAGDLLSDLGSFGLEVQTVDLGDGDWAIEGRLPYEGLALDPSVIAPFQPKIGMITPANYVGNDGDDPAGGRQGQLFWAQDEATNNSWNTPSSWEKEHVIYDPKVFGLGGGGTAVEATSWGSIKAEFSE